MVSCICHCVEQIIAVVSTGKTKCSNPGVGAVRADLIKEGKKKHRPSALLSGILSPGSLVSGFQLTLCTSEAA